MHVMKNLMVPMRDGVRLATDVYLPNATNAPLPVIIERTPYNKSMPSRSEKRFDGHHLGREEMAAAFAAKGFVTVFQDCRGRYESEGEFVKYINEGEDGYDTLSWLVEQPWCNGRVGSMGLSYAAHTQLAMACLSPPGLCTMVLDSGGFANAFHCGIRQGGAFELKQVTWAYKQAKESPTAKADPHLRASLEKEDIHQWFANMPWQSGHSPLRHAPEYEDYLLDQWRRGNYDSYWQQLGLCADHYRSTIPDIPVLHMSSWYDAYVSSTLDNFNAFIRHGNAPQRLIMGPWLHGDRNITHSGDAEYGLTAAFDGHVEDDWLACRLRWFETHLLQASSTTPPPQQVQVFIMGGGSGRKDVNQRIDHGGEWLTTSRWPLPGSQQMTLHFHADGVLREDAPEKSTRKTYQADPLNPVPTIGGALTSGAPVFAGGAYDQRESSRFFGARGDNEYLSDRPDVLSFETNPLSADLVVAGSIEFELWVETDGLDTDFTAKLIDVYPPSTDYPEGFAMNITDGIIRCRYRDSWSDPTPTVPGLCFKVSITPFATCNRFKAGHRLRVDIASSNFPRFDVNPNSGEPQGQAVHKRVALNTVHMSRERPSRVSMAVLPDQS
ncbi:CocE/NonD family hydrolase [Pseudomonas sp. C1C7]|uniref:CocE/NonD family hydrolase n=1 Tax=Pseudomonas sp. C1C7 TaxID=2735272 RepID=UPI001586C47F|nr:CocE/NonD family hydrolase [Pseudomonas sp. C1C7]NUT77639.1 CocE/NonD family hydrolase [Pseudomonas sp. C1C7]